MDETRLAKKKIATFLAITFALSAIYYAAIISAGTLSAGSGLLVFGLMWSPGLAGLATQLIYTRSLRGLGWKPGRYTYLLAAYLLPLGYCLVVYGFTWLSGLGGFPDPAGLAAIQARLGAAAVPPALAILITALAGLPGGLLSGVGEEIGWRGLFVPELARVTSFTGAALVSGAVWAAWHMPLIFFADYNLPGVPGWYAGLMFASMVVGMSFIYAWLRLRSGSLWPAAVLHASHNLFVQLIFTPLTSQGAATPYIIDEFGAGLALFGVAMGLYFWRRSRAAGPQPVVKPASL